MKKSKQVYYDKYFERSWNNIKNTWKGIKSLVSLKTVAFSSGYRGSLAQLGLG